MNLVGEKIRHKMLGTGVILVQEKDILTIEFSSKTSKFQYNEATFTKFLSAEDVAVQALVLKEFEDARIAAQQKAEEEALAKQRLEEEKKAALSAKYAGHIPKKNVVKHERVPGKRMTFYVFQGSTFDRESKGGYIWAPIASKDGGAPHHWTRLLDVQPGDIILHGCNAQVQAISIARGKCYECNQPKELQTEDMWETEGRRVDCEYIVFDRPIKTSHYTTDILRLCNVKYAPFDKDGNGNMGYLYELNRELAQIFLRGLVKLNPSLAYVDYVAELLSET
ncbi:MAG: hypothetical protein IKU81_05660 [Oscillibacter sp.]|nr:hypothetical protein [Oscillibacter sp.]